MMEVVHGLSMEGINCMLIHEASAYFVNLSVTMMTLIQYVRSQLHWSTGSLCQI